MPRLDSDRLITILDAANRILQKQMAMRKEFDIYCRDPSPIAVNTVFEIINRHMPDYEDISIILTERNHFTDNYNRILSARLKMQRLRGNQKATTIMTTEVEKVGLNLTDYKQNQTGAIEPTKQQLIPNDQSSDYSLPVEPTLGDYHELARQKFGAVLIFKGEICRAIQEAKPELSADEIVMIVERLLDEIPEGKSIQYLSQGSRDRVLINDIP